MKRKEIYRISFIIVTSVFLIICNGKSSAQAQGKGPPPMPPIVEKLVADAKKSVKSIDMETLKAVLDRNEDVTILDVRLPDEYAEGHIPRAINIPRGFLEFKVWKEVVGFPEKTDTSKKIYVYCGLGTRSALATKSLQEIGFTNAILVAMKLAEWKKAGFPIEK